MMKRAAAIVFLVLIVFLLISCCLSLSKLLFKEGRGCPHKNQLFLKERGSQISLIRAIRSFFMLPIR